jgi:hypothetical protein
MGEQEHEEGVEETPEDEEVDSDGSDERRGPERDPLSDY